MDRMAAVGGATRSLGTQMDVWGTQYQRWQLGRSQMNAEQSNWYQEQYQSELRTYYSMLDENKDKPGTYSWAALENQKRILDEAGMTAPQDCRVEDSKRTGEEFAAAKAALGDLAQSEEDIMSYICYPAQAEKYLEGRKAAEENKVTYTITEA